MKTPRPTKPVPFEASPFEARQALREGEEGPIESYLAGLAAGLSLLAKSIQRSENDQRPIEAVQTPKSDEASSPIELEEEWDASLADFVKVHKEGNIRLIASYLQDASDIVSQVSRALEPDSGATGWKLEFKQVGRGRRPVDPMEKSLRESYRRLDLFMRTRRLGKQDAAFAEIADERGVSRATSFRAKKAGKSAKKTKPKLKKKPTKSTR